MTYQRPAYEQVTIAHGGNTVALRPSLRAAVSLEARFGFAVLFRALDEGSFTIISEIILSASSSDQGAAAFLSGDSGRPLSSFFAAVRKPLAELVLMLQPAPDPQAKPVTNSGKSVAWPDFYADLYEKATGWLGWTPETAWNATPTEIDRAYSGHIAKLKAIHGSSEDDKQPTEKAPDSEQAARNVAAGLDPEFDRARLRALKAKIAGGVLSKPARICSCGRIVPHGDLCECQRTATRERNARHDARRPSARARGYDHEWRKARAEYLALHPHCRECSTHGVTRLATVVDHIIPHRGDKRLFWHRANWQPLCAPCHNSIKQRQERSL